MRDLTLVEIEVGSGGWNDSEYGIEMPEIVVTASRNSPSPWFSILGGAGLVSGSGYGGGQDFFNFGVGVGLALNLGITGSPETAAEAANDEGLLLCLAICSDWSFDPFGPDYSFEGSFGVGAFLYSSIPVNKK